VTAIQEQPQWVVAIEGYENLLTSGPTAAAITAWAASSWSAALSGLSVRIEGEQRFDPWSTDLTPRECILTVRPDSIADTFGVAVHRGGGGVETYLETALDCDDLAVVGLNTSAFPASGSIYVGLERMLYSSHDGTTFTITQRGAYAPFSISGGTDEYGRAHALPSVDYDVNQKPIISSIPRSWIGKWVGVWKHVRSNGVPETRANAECVFGGTIESIEDTSEGATIVHVVECKQRPMDTVLLHDQWTARLSEGVYISDALDFDMSAASYVGGADGVLQAATLNITTGTYTADEVAALIADWLRDDGTLTGTWHCYIDANRHFVIDHDSAGVAATIYFRCAPHVAAYLGLIEEFNGTGGYHSFSAGPANEPRLTSDFAVAKVQFCLVPGGTLTLDGSMGSWFNNLDHLPPDLRALTDGAGSWGVVQIGDQLAVAKLASATSLTDVIRLDALTNAMLLTIQRSIVRDDSSGTDLVLRQVAIIHGSASLVLLRLFASTGVTDYNVGGYDVYPAQLGAAMPWDLLGTAFYDSVNSLEQATTAGALTLVIEQPTPLWKAIGADMLLRAAYLVWKDGGLIFATIQTPSSSHYDHVWTEDDKASAAGPSDKQRTITQTTSEYLRNVLLVRYNRAALDDADAYNATTEARYTRSIQEAGGEYRQEIDARNSYGAYASGGAAVEDLTSDLMASVMPLFGRPLKVMTRTISPEYFSGVAPGDVVLISDDHARNAISGAREISNKPGLVLAHRCSYGGDGEDAFGEAEVLFLDQDRTAPYCPTAEVASWSAFEVTCEEHSHSESTAAVDASHFAAGDEVVIVEIDPDDPAAPDSIATTVVSVVGSVITVDDDADALTGTRYRIMSPSYGAAVAAQRTDTYLADDADGLIADVAEPYVYAHQSSTSYTIAATTQLAERHVTAHIGDGSPLAVGPAAAMGINANSLISRVTAPHSPDMPEAAVSTSSTDWVLVRCVPYFYGRGQWPSGYIRKVTVAPMLWIDIDEYTAASVRVTLSKKPPEGSGIAPAHRLTPYSSLTFTSTSATPAAAAAQSIAPVYDHSTGRGWIYVELKSGDAGVPACYWGMELWLGPLETY